jgi:NitT/TauT family transport system ATP-binding protein
MTETKLEIDDISKSFTNGSGETVDVLDSVSFDVTRGSFTSIMGPSGCGKTTLLNIVAGLLDIDGGTIKEDGVPRHPGELFCPYVFQEPRLLDWATVGENISFVLSAQDIPKSEHDELIEEHLDKVGLDGEADSYPQELSGGMQQRVGIARALSVDSDVILMDEPFSSLDEITASTLRADLVDLWQETGKTILFVTHDMREAIYLSETVLFMAPGDGIFHRADIDIARPRSMDDTDLLQRESELMSIMSEHIDEGR